MSGIQQDSKLEEELAAALKAFDSEAVLRLCARLISNIPLTVNGWTASVAHHVAQRRVSEDCLRLLIDRLGPACLSCRDEDGQTPVHKAAFFEDPSWLLIIQGSAGNECLRLRDNAGWTAAHCASFNCNQLSSLQWLVQQLGSDCLKVPNNRGNTPVHFAAEFNSAASLQFIFDQLGAEMLSLKNSDGETPADWVEKDSDDSRKCSKQAWIANQQRVLLRAPQPGPPPLPTQPFASSSVQSSTSRDASDAASPEATSRTAAEGSTAQRTSKLLDPDFNSWNFLLQDGERQCIGEGAFGQVFKAITDRYQTVAVKIVPLTGGSEKVKRALELEKRGVEVLKAVRHPNIVLFLKCEETSAEFRIFTELVSGLSLWDLMKQQQKPFEESGVKDFSGQICSGLNFLHSQPQGPILHRDIKCSNIMLTNEGVIKLIDFGLAKGISTTCGLTTGPERPGTQHFMAPELFSDDESMTYSVKTDVWAFGCTVFEMTETRPPDANVPGYRIPVLRFHKRAMPQIAEKFSADLKDFYRRCVAMEPEERADTAVLLRHRFLTS